MHIIGIFLFFFFFFFLLNIIPLWIVKRSGAADEMYDPIDEVRIEL